MNYYMLSQAIIYNFTLAKLIYIPHPCHYQHNFYQIFRENNTLLHYTIA